MILFLPLLYLVLLLPFVQSQNVAGTCNPPNQPYTTCNKCIQMSGIECGWCPDNLAQEGCMPRSSSSNCSQWQWKGKKGVGVQKTWRREAVCHAALVAPATSGNGKFKYLDSREVSRGDNLDYIKPSNVQLKLRPNVKHQLQFKASKAQLAMDMYFLFDQSGTMKEILEVLSSVATELSEELAKLTTDRKFGFGIFKEKPILPFDVRRDYRYDFEHLVDLTSNISEIVEKAPRDGKDFAGNLDNPESGLDALLQLLKCGDKIGWRKDATRTIVYLTDATFHLSGDGNLAGLWKPYEQSCKLQQTGASQTYDALNNDYPSLSVLNYELQKEEIFLIFGLTSTIKNSYKPMIDSKDLYAWIGTMGSGRGNAVGQLKDLLVEMYREIKDDLRVGINNPNDNLDIKLSFGSNSKCSTKPAGQLDSNSIMCDEAVVGQEIDFIAEITMNETACLSESPLSFSLKVFGQEESTLEVEIMPDCDCECMQQPEKNSAICFGNGTLECGVCNCNDGFYGDKCECSKENQGTSIYALSNEDQINCTNPTSNSVCSTKGTCSCGKCDCNQPYFGTYCECKEDTCDCGDKGKCTICNGQRVGECKCDKGYEVGPSGNCDCSINTDQCVDPFSGLTCSNNGKCKCNACECDVGEGKYCQNPKTAALDSNQYTCNRLTPCTSLLVYRHILESNPSDSQLLKNLENSCNDTKLLQQGRLSCLFTVNSSNVFTDNDEWTELGTSNDCLYQPEFDITNKRRCEAVFKDCPYFFYHDAPNDGIDSYTTKEEGNVKIFVTYLNKSESVLTKFNEDRDLKYDLSPITCPYMMPKWMIITISGTSALFVFIFLFLAYFIIINLEERRKYKEFKRRANTIFDDGNVYINPLSRLNRASTFFRKRMSVINRIINSPSVTDPSPTAPNQSQ